MKFCATFGINNIRVQNKQETLFLPLMLLKKETNYKKWYNVLIEKQSTEVRKSNYYVLIVFNLLGECKQFEQI